MRTVESNIWKLYVLYAIRGALIHIPITVIFLQSNGLSLQQVFILQALWSVIQITLEIPSGYIADRWGRKQSIVLGGVCKCIGIFLYCIGTTFVTFGWAVSFLAIGSSFFSGSMEALTYDSLLTVQKTKLYRKIAGKQAFCQFGSEAIGSIIGGVLALISLRTPFYYTFGFFCVAPCIAATLIEPKKHKEHHKGHFQAMYDICKESLIHNKTLRTIILMHSILVTITFTLHWFTQPYEELVGLPLALFGTMHMIIVGTHAIASRWAHHLEKWFDDRVVLSSLAVIIVLCLFAIAAQQSLWALVFFLIARACWGLLTPISTEIINRLTPSHTRATVLSLRSLLFRVFFALIAPCVGYIADVLSLREAIALTGIVSATVVVVMLLMMRSVWSSIPR